MAKKNTTGGHSTDKGHVAPESVAEAMGSETPAHAPGETGGDVYDERTPADPRDDKLDDEPAEVVFDMATAKAKFIALEDDIARAESELAKVKSSISADIAARNVKVRIGANVYFSAKSKTGELTLRREHERGATIV